MSDRRILGRRLGPPVAWCAVFAGSLALAALVAPVAFSAILAVEPETRITLSRVFNRAAMLFALVMLILFRRHLGWFALHRLLVRGSRRQRAGELGIGLAIAMAVAVGGVGWALLTNELGPTLNEYHLVSWRTATTTVGALAAAFIEESFFRGLMLASLTAGIGWWSAALTSSSLYSAVHLLSSDRSFVWEGYAAGAGLAYLVQSVSRQLEPEAMPPLLGLFIGGFVLAVVVRATDSLYLVVGLHAGWIICFQVVRHATRVMHPISGSSALATRHYLVGTAWVWAVMVLSGALGIVVLKWLSSRVGRSVADSRT